MQNDKLCKGHTKKYEIYNNTVRCGDFVAQQNNNHALWHQSVQLLTQKNLKDKLNEKICYPPSLDHLPFFGDNFTLGVSKILSVSDSSRMCGPAAIFYISVWMLVHCTVHLAANSLALVAGNCTQSCRKSWKSSAITCWSQPQNWHHSKSGNCKVCALGKKKFFAGPPWNP